MKKYATLKCSACARTKDELIDQTHYTPDRCTITLNCEGRLSPIGYTSDGTSVLSIPPTGLTNWYARGSTVTPTVGLQADVLYDTSTGQKKQIYIAVQDPLQSFSSVAVLKLNLIAEQQTPKDYRQYIYRRSGSFTIINGIEDGAAKKVLRYNITGVDPDQVEVYVDGVKRTNGLGANDYQLYDGSIGSPVPLNSVLFNSPVTGAVPQVDVVVTKAATVSTVQLTFTRAIDDEARVGIGAWEGIDYVKSSVLGAYSLFYCDFTEVSGALALDIKLRLDPSIPSIIIDGPTTTVNPSAAALLLSRSQLYTQLDRQRALWVPLVELSSNTNYLMIKLVAGVKTLFVTELSAKNLFPVLDVVRFKSPSLETLHLLGNTDAAQLDNTIIIGPDA